MWNIYLNYELASTHVLSSALDDVTEDYVYSLTEQHGPLDIDIQDDEDRFERYILWSKIK